MIFETKLQKMPVLPYILLLSFIAVITKISLYLLTEIIYMLTNLSLLSKLAATENNYTLNSEFILSVIVLAPLLETVIGQWLPIVVSRKVIKNTYALILISSLVFAALHEPASMLTGLGVGIILSYNFLLKEKVSKETAFYTTIAIHAVHNLSALLLFVWLGN